MGYAAQSDTGFAHNAVLANVERCRNGHQRESVRRAVTQFQIDRVTYELLRWRKLDMSDQFTGSQ